MSELRDRTRRTSLAAAATLLAVALVACACTAGDEPERAAGSDAATSDTLAPEGAPEPGGTLSIGIANETNGWNPHDNQWAQAGSIVGTSILEPLATLDPELRPVPWLATSWTPNDTFDSWTLELREDVTFHDGTAFDAAAVKANLDDINTAPLTGIVWDKILGDVTVVDDHTVRVGLTEPFASFPTTFLSAQTGIMMAPSMFSAERRGSTHPVGTGPFVFGSWTSGSRFETTKNPDYWQDGKPYLDGIDFVILGDSAAISAALQARDVDLAFTAAISAAQQAPESFTVLKDWTSEPGMAMTNTLAEVNGQPNPVANHHARLALAHATDQQALADAVGEGVETPNSPFPPNSPWGMAPEDNGYVDFDVAAARDEVAAYEAETGRPLAITLSIVSGPDVAKIGQLLQSQWAEAGIETSIESAEATTFISNVVGGKYQVALFGFYGSPDPDQNYHFWSAENANGAGAISINFTQYTTPTMDENLRIGRQSADVAARKAAYDAIVREINGAAVNIWTFSTPYSIIAAPQVHGLQKAAEVPFGNYQPKTWYADLWLTR